MSLREVVVSYAAFDLRIGILELFVDAAQMGRRKEFHLNALVLQREGGAPQPKCVLCGSQSPYGHTCPGAVFAPVSVSFPMPPQRYFETKPQKIRKHVFRHCNRCGARSGPHRCPG